MGSSARKRTDLLVTPLLDWTFTLDLILNGNQISVSRNTANPSQVFIEGDISDWPKTPRATTLSGTYMYEVKEWTNILGTLMFGLPVEGFNRQYEPSFRSLVSYFIRRSKDAYTTPFEHYRKQFEWDKQINNAFLLELAWEDASDWQLLKDEKKAISELQRATATGLIKSVLGSRGELEAERIRLEAQADQQQESLATFRVHPQYQEISEQVDRLTVEIYRATNENVVANRLLTLNRNSLTEEQEPDPSSVTRIYEEAGVVLPGLVQHRLEEVRNFHLQLLVNRRGFLSNEVNSLLRDVERRRTKIQNKTEERAQLMIILRDHGALEEYNRLQQLHLQTVSKVNDITSRLETLKSIEGSKSNLRLKEDQLFQRALRDYEERLTQRATAIMFFNEHSEALYQAPGKLVIDIGSKGFRFGVDIQRSSSGGIGNMKIFCYDLMLAQLWSMHNPSLHFFNS